MCVCACAQGTILRQKAEAIPQQSRTATGVIVQKMGEADGIKGVALVPELDHDDEDAAAAAVAVDAVAGKVFRKSATA